MNSMAMPGGEIGRKKGRERYVRHIVDLFGVRKEGISWMSFPWQIF